MIYSEHLYKESISPPPISSSPSPIIIMKLRYSPASSIMHNCFSARDLLIIRNVAQLLKKVLNKGAKIIC